MKRQYVECSCSSNEHTLRFDIDSDPELPAIYVSTFLAHHDFFGRIWNSIKYIFGYNCKYGHFEEVVLDVEQVKQLKEICDNFLSDNDVNP